MIVIVTLKSVAFPAPQVKGPPCAYAGGGRERERYPAERQGLPRVDSLVMNAWYGRNAVYLLLPEQIHGGSARPCAAKVCQKRKEE